MLLNQGLITFRFSSIFRLILNQGFNSYTFEWNIFLAISIKLTIPKKIAEESRALSEFLAMIEITKGEITAPMSIIIKHNVVARLLNWSGTLKEIALKIYGITIPKPAPSTIHPTTST